MTPILRLLIGLLVGLVGLIAMVRLVSGGFTSGMRPIVWIITGAAMVGWVVYVGWRTRRSRIDGRSVLLILVFAIVGSVTCWLWVGGAVLALACSLAAFAVIWLHDLPPRRQISDSLSEYVRMDELNREADHSEDRPGH